VNQYEYNECMIEKIVRKLSQNNYTNIISK